MKFLRRRELVPTVLTVIAFIAGAIASPYFLDIRYLLGSSSLYVEIGLMALAMTLVIVSGNIDLSVASNLALVGCVTAKLLAGGWSAPAALFTGLALGTVLGYLNGVLVSRVKLPSFVVTLATMAAYRGAAQVLVGSESAKVPPALAGVDYIKLPGTPVPLPLVIFVVFAIAFSCLLHRTVFGRWVVTVGTNARAAAFSGVPVERVTTLVFTLAGFISGFAGLILASRLGVARFDNGRGAELDVITAVVLGGASIAGGTGSILGTCLALLLVALLRTGMGVANVTADYQFAVIGTLLVISVMINNSAERWFARRTLGKAK